MNRNDALGVHSRNELLKVYFEKERLRIVLGNQNYFIVAFYIVNECQCESCFEGNAHVYDIDSK